MQWLPAVFGYRVLEIFQVGESDRLHSYRLLPNLSSRLERSSLLQACCSMTLHGTSKNVLAKAYVAPALSSIPRAFNSSVFTPHETLYCYFQVTRVGLVLEQPIDVELTP